MINISGKVIKGQQFGRVLGFPTANLDRRHFSRMRMKIKLGIYAGWVWLPFEKKYPAAIVIGPIDNRGLPKIEAHLLNFKDDLYGKTLRMALQKYIRPFKKFKSEEELRMQIKNDIIKVKKILKSHG